MKKYDLGICCDREHMVEVASGDYIMLDEPIDIRQIERHDLNVTRWGGWQEMENSEYGEWMRTDDVISFLEKNGFKVIRQENRRDFGIED